MEMVEAGAFSINGRNIIDRLNEPEIGRMLAALEKLSHEPPEGDIRKMSGRDNYRLKLSDLRVLFEIRNDEIFVTNIDRRGQIYKGRGKHK